MFDLFSKQTKPKQIKQKIKLAKGDQIHIRAGKYTWNQYVEVNVEGSAANPIVIRSYMDDKVSIQQQNIDQNIIDFKSANYTYWYNIEFFGGSAGFKFGGSNNWNVFDSLFIHDTQFSLFQTNGAGAFANNVLQNSELSQIANYGIGVHLADVALNNSISHCHIHHTYNTATRNSGSGIRIGANSYGNAVFDNLIHHTFEPGIYVTTTNLPSTIPRNRIARNLIWNSIDRCMQVNWLVEVSYNIMVDCNGVAFANAVNTVFDHNTVYGNYKDFVKIVVFSNLNFCF